MCDERERLIGYLYDEADAAERRQVDAHLLECHVCRAEIAALRRVREDLLAWDVPDHEPIWRPVAPPAPARTWSQVPAWALAAAAGLVFTAGVAGGAATRVFWPESRPAPAVASVGTPATPVASTAPTMGPTDLAALEARVVNRVRAELQQQMRAVSSRDTSAGATIATVSTATPGGGSLEALRRQVADLERWRNDQIGLNFELDRKMNRISNRYSSLDSQMMSWELSGLNTLRVNNTGGSDPGR